MNAKQIIADLLQSGAKFSISTDVAYGRGINGVGYDSYVMYEERGSEGNPKTKVYRTFEPKDDCLVITEKYVYPEIPWSRAPRKEPATYRIYLDYGRITHITETV